ncbi:acetyltransferase [Pusillimonas sp. TS35]|uniref:acetyltransferase n=1 Tax=Paracandidimonas lactea TaxID=2895524 RepID=UPI001368CAB3|nr:acetyltransferase [Paracandidimonas lactea]MYN13572.1 acetyltransferase [Pusillimonas sp. TS35]
MDVYAIVGTGGHGRETMAVAELMLAASAVPGSYRLLFVDEQQRAGDCNGHDVLRPEQFLAQAGCLRFNIAIADSRCRQRLTGLLCAGGASPFTIAAPNSCTLAHSEIGPGAILSPFSLVTANVRIGQGFHANMYAYVAHDCIIGDFVTLGPHACCNGGIVVEDHAYIGTGAIIRQSRPGQRIVIGEGAVVGMGAVVTRSVSPYTTVVGNPARPHTRHCGTHAQPHSQAGTDDRPLPHQASKASHEH